MTRRGFIGTLLGAALAPKTMLAKTAPASFFGGRVELLHYRDRRPSSVPERLIMKLHNNSLYGKFAA